MASFVWNDLIDRARFYIDDDHRETAGWVTPARWLTRFGVEYAQQDRRWVRQGLVAPRPTHTTFVGPTTALTGVLAVVGVAEDLGGGRYREIPSVQSEIGRHPYGTPSDIGWQAHGTGDDLSIEISPDDELTYEVRWIPDVVRPSDPTASVVLPASADERLVLGAARRALVKESTRSSALQQALDEVDAELAFAAAGRLMGDAPRVRRLNPSSYLFV